MVAVLGERSSPYVEDPNAIFLIPLRMLATYGSDATKIMDERVANLLRHHDVEAAQMWRLWVSRSGASTTMVAGIKAEVSASV